VNFRVALGALLGGLIFCCASSLAQTPPDAPKATAKSAPPTAVRSVKATPTRPTWNELTPAQREALAPLAGMWPTLDAERKRKWLEVAARYPNLSPEGKQRMQERMAELANLTPEQRQTLRENFKRAYALPADQRQEKLQKYQDLPEDKKRELAGQASKKKKEPPRRPTRDLELDPVAAPPGAPTR
jgi:hypothetical protein